MNLLLENLCTIFICISWILNLFRIDIRNKRIPALGGPNYENYKLIESSLIETKELAEIQKAPVNPEFELQDIKKINIVSNITEWTNDVVELNHRRLPSYSNNNFAKHLIESFFHWLTQDILINIRVPLWVIIVSAFHFLFQIGTLLIKLLPKSRKTKIVTENSLKELPNPDLTKNMNVDCEVNQRDIENDNFLSEFYYPDGTICVLRGQLIEESEDENILY